MSRYFRDSIKKNSEKLKNYLNPFSKQNSLNRSGVNFPNFAFSELIDVAKYGRVRVHSNADAYRGSGKLQ